MGYRPGRAGGRSRAGERQIGPAGEGRTTFVLELLQVGRGDPDRAGGKGASLGELIRAGFPVPPGFVVTTGAYDRFVAHNGLGETIARMLREDDPSTIRRAFEAAPVPPEVQRAVLAAYGRLGLGPVAVRSSATAEDLPEAAFAGQQDSFLNVVGPDELLHALRRCWASLWTGRAIAYRARLALDQRTVKLAVVVQRFVAAEAAGVLFTANPITGARDEVIVDASPALPPAEAPRRRPTPPPAALAPGRGPVWHSALHRRRDQNAGRKPGARGAGEPHSVRPGPG